MQSDSHCYRPIQNSTRLSSSSVFTIDFLELGVLFGEPLRGMIEGNEMRRNREGEKWKEKKKEERGERKNEYDEV